MPQFLMHPSSYRPRDSFESSDCAQPARITKPATLRNVEARTAGAARKRAETARRSGNVLMGSKRADGRASHSQPSKLDSNQPSKKSRGKCFLGFSKHFRSVIPQNRLLKCKNL